MEMLPVKPEHKAQLDNYAQRHGQEWEQQDYNETVEAVMEAYADVKAGRTQPANEFLEEPRVKHGLPR